MKLMSFEQRAARPGAWCAARSRGPVRRVARLADRAGGRRRAHRPGGRPRRHALYAPGGLQWLPPVPNPRKILCVGLNYGRHVLEAGRLPAHPSLFIRYADSFVGHGQDMWKPRASDRYDYEGELAVVIGRAGRHIAARDALSHVAGYTCMAENSVRDFQKHNAQVTPGRTSSAARAGPLAGHRRRDRRPGAVAGDDAAERRDPATGRGLGPDFSHRRADRLHQRLHPLSPGDVIATGTPEGVGSSRKPPRFMAAGDTLEVDIPGVGTLVNRVADEPAPAHQEQGDAHG